MTGAIGDMRDEPRAAPPFIPGGKFVDRATDCLDDFQIGAFAVATDVVDLTHPSPLEHEPDCAAVVGHIQPVPDLPAVAVDRQRLALQTVEDHQRDQLFRKLMRAVVVGAVGRERGQAVGVMIGADKVVAGAGGNDTRHIAKLAAASAAKGVAGILSVAPYYNKPCQEGIYRHFRAIADAAAIPVLLYNVPGRTIANIDAATTERIATDQKNVIGTKEASGNMMQVADIVSRTPDTFDVYSGDDGTLLPHLAVGGCGIISVISHVATPQMKAVCTKWFAGDAAGAREAFLRTLGITRMIFAQPSPAPTKAALSLLGKPAGPVRLPLVDLNQCQLETLAAFMTEQGLM